MKDRRMSTRTKTGIRFILFFIVFLANSAASISDVYAMGSYYRGPFKGRVVDQDDNQPIEGAVVYVEWDKRYIGVERADYYDANEVLTDKNGAFYIPAKWSWNPWLNLRLNASVVIFKAGYGNAQINWPDLKGWITLFRTYSQGWRKQGNPDLYFDIRFDGDEPVFLLRKLATEDEHRLNNPYGRGNVIDPLAPLIKRSLLMQEINRERKVVGLSEYID